MRPSIPHLTVTQLFYMGQHFIGKGVLLRVISARVNLSLRKQQINVDTPDITR